ncbi:hypothetical protein HY285_01100 [Candidatus Peregrinibacteria bacterium]|nr:hypothetical protein [Candidatus Peregrinibacteria bacterium]
MNESGSPIEEQKRRIDAAVDGRVDGNIDASHADNKQLTALYLGKITVFQQTFADVEKALDRRKDERNPRWQQFEAAIVTGKRSFLVLLEKQSKADIGSIPSAQKFRDEADRILKSVMEEERGSEEKGKPQSTEEVLGEMNRSIKPSLPPERLQKIASEARTHYSDEQIRAVTVTMSMVAELNVQEQQALLGDAYAPALVLNQLARGSVDPALLSEDIQHCLLRARSNAETHVAQLTQQLVSLTQEKQKHFQSLLDYTTSSKESDKKAKQTALVEEQREWQGILSNK